MQVALIDYGAGNLHSVAKALAAAGVPARRTRDPREAAAADALVLPGQGHFGQVMAAFRASGFERVVREHLDAGRPFLGICVGLQLLMERSDEAPGVPGLGLLPGRVVRFPADAVSVPHMGWNTLHPWGASPLLAGIDDGAHAYFAHSYLVAFDDVDPAGGAGPVSGAVTQHGTTRFLSAVSRGSIHATQFHPEKSQRVGLRLLANFAGVVRAHHAGAAA
ncbi:MAG: imidazole glycerol phosphate synthase subunit HisH [bacterium]|nr:imidazole glycerol phosphate synthase subunit HisH [bacterium]